MELFEAGRAAVEGFLAEYQTRGSVARRVVAPRPPVVVGEGAYQRRRLTRTLYDLVVFSLI
jgi:hypothetical protein